MQFKTLFFALVISAPLMADENKQQITQEVTSVEINEQIDLSVSDTIKDSSIVMPESLNLTPDSLLSDWFLKHHTYIDSTCISRDENILCSDSVYMQRLAALPNVMEMTFNSVVKSYIEVYTQRRRTLVEYMLGLGHFYFPIFEEVLDKYQMPLELKYLPVIESALKPIARSRVGATGLWQFMLPTARYMGLEVNSLTDDRCDPYKSTDAAARYLKQLYDTYEDWNLAIAAYNCGAGNVNKAIKRSGGKKNYWEIYYYLPRETRGYVPAFIAANYVMNYHREHNICPVLTEMPISSDTIVINQMIHLKQISEMLNVDMEQLRVLNPQYRRDIVPGNVKPSVLRLPTKNLYTFIEHQDTISKYKAEEYLVNINREVGPGGLMNASGTTIHKVRSGETLGLIAKKYGTTVKEIKYLNGLKSDNLRIGQQLIVYGSAKKTSSTSGNTQKNTVKSEPYKGEFSLHTVKEGESLWVISQKYSGATVENIKDVNNLSKNALRVGQIIKIPIN